MQLTTKHRRTAERAAPLHPCLRLILLWGAMFGGVLLLDLTLAAFGLPNYGLLPFFLGR